MKFTIQNTTGYNLPRLMRHLGYVPFHDAYTRRLGTGFYPRFHVYADERGNDITINLHLDQKKQSYQNQTAHSADYGDSSALEEEKERILLELS
ncbi:hypothetical protein HOD96_01955 [Candidatus Falkowbacteria bacterium]|jgi:hypothetical protein|nr:hypothetical protein [Candidatus Falkowbacteria bacterium]MBT4433054.1 hypothetical protein [Candidatus Falkowbacteria bacterium]